MTTARDKTSSDLEVDYCIVIAFLHITVITLHALVRFRESRTRYYLNYWFTNKSVT